jgi:hypothetical protein
MRGFPLLPAETVLAIGSQGCERTTRSDRQKLAGLGLLMAGKDGQQELFRAPADLAARFHGLELAGQAGAGGRLATPWKTVRCCSQRLISGGRNHESDRRAFGF